MAVIPSEKRCTKCREVLPVECFGKHKLGQYGLRPRCRSCTAEDAISYRERTADRRAAYNKRYYEEHREEKLAYNRTWNKSNRESLNRATKEWRGRNKEKVAAQKRAWRETHPEAVRAHKKTEYDRHMEAIVYRVAKWRRANPDKRRAQSQLRRARRRQGSVVPGYTTGEKMAWRREMFGGRCVYCGGDGHTMDHQIPLSRGGLHLPANLVPACGPCNSRKSNLSVAEFRARLGSIA